MLPRDSEDVERREVSGPSTRFYIELRADAASELRPTVLRGKHPGQEKQIACLHRFCVGPKRLRRGRQLDTKLFQPLLGAGRSRAFAGHHLSMCAASTCSTSAVA